MSIFIILFSLFFLSSSFLNFFSTFHCSCCLFWSCRRINIGILGCLSCFFSNHLSKSILCVFWGFLIHKASGTRISLLFIKFKRLGLCWSLLRFLFIQIVLKVFLKLVKIRNVSSFNWFEIISLFWLLRLKISLLFLNLLMHFHSRRQFCFLIA